MREQIRDLKAQAQAGGLPLLQALHPEHCGQGVFNLVQHELKILHGLGKQISLLIVLRMPGDARRLYVWFVGQRKYGCGGVTPVSAKKFPALIINHLRDRIRKAAGIFRRVGPAVFADSVHVQHPAITQLPQGTVSLAADPVHFIECRTGCVLAAHLPCR